jgi:nucleoside-diphosphate-sugar epimerase
VLVPGGGGIGSRLVERELRAVFGPSGIDVRLVRYRDDGRDPARWYQNADDRRAVLDSWLQLLVPFLSGYESGAGT